MSKLHANNFVNIQSFMVTDLNLKGNELLIYAIIYGFSQTDDTSFTGGLQYLADWTNSTKQGVIKNLKSLLEKGFITKTENRVGGVKFVEYRSTLFNGVVNNIEQKPLNFVEQGGKQSLTNNKEDTKEKQYKEYTKTIVEYLNRKAGTHWRSDTKDTIKHIKARLDEHYTLDDFFAVIDRKCADWLGTEWQDYLRPMTLFGTKFESYLNAKGRKANRRGANGIALDDRRDDDLDGIL